MRTAEEIINNVWESEKYSMADNLNTSMVIDAINEARIEAIKECAEAVSQNYNLTIDKQSILSLIKQIK